MELFDLEDRTAKTIFRGTKLQNFHITTHIGRVVLARFGFPFLIVLKSIIIDYTI